MNKFLLILTCVAVFISCETMVHEVGNGEITTETHNINSFKEIIVSGNFEIMLIKGESEKLEIMADENLLEFIKVINESDRLRIETTKRLRSRDGIKLKITYRELASLEVAGAALVQSDDVIEGDYMEIEMSGAGSVDLEVDLNTLEISMSGAGAVELYGKVDRQEIQMSGAGALNASGLYSNHTRISISGVGGAKIYAKESLDAEVSGVGGIVYKGNPKEIKTDVSGLGTISKDDDHDHDL